MVACPTPSQMRNVVSQSEISRRLTVGRSAVGNWPARYSDFPTPINPDTDDRSLYWWPDIDSWHRKQFGSLN